MTGAPPLIEARRVSMSFPGVRALGEVDFDFRAGKVPTLIGENGAGKFTLIRILSGEITGFQGEVRLDGRPIDLPSPRPAIDAGIAVIPGAYPAAKAEGRDRRAAGDRVGRAHPVRRTGAAQGRPADREDHPRERPQVAGRRGVVPH